MAAYIGQGNSRDQALVTHREVMDVSTLERLFERPGVDPATETRQFDLALCPPVAAPDLHAGQRMGIRRLCWLRLEQRKILFPISYKRPLDLQRHLVRLEAVPRGVFGQSREELLGRHRPTPLHSQLDIEDHAGVDRELSRQGRVTVPIEDELIGAFLQP